MGQLHFASIGGKTLVTAGTFDINVMLVCATECQWKENASVLEKMNDQASEQRSGFILLKIFRDARSRRLLQ